LRTRNSACINPKGFTMSLSPARMVLIFGKDVCTVAARHEGRVALFTLSSSF